jgi:hypothetical protein
MPKINSNGCYKTGHLSSNGFYKFAQQAFKNYPIITWRELTELRGTNPADFAQRTFLY